MCADAIPIVEDTPILATNVGATTANEWDDIYYDVWYEYIPVRDGTALISCEAPVWDCRFAVFNACGGGRYSGSHVSVTQGVSYFIAVGGYADGPLDNLQGEFTITKEHIQNNKSIRSVLLERGIRPEALPSEDDLKKLERRVRAGEKALVKVSALPPDEVNDSSSEKED